MEMVTPRPPPPKKNGARVMEKENYIGNRYQEI